VQVIRSFNLSGLHEYPAKSQGVTVMKDYKEEGLALAGMLVVLLGVMFAAAATVA
jgi:hypothetical protein